MTTTTAAFGVWKQNCACADAAQRFGRAWLRDPRWPLALRYSVAMALLTGETLH